MADVTFRSLSVWPHGQTGDRRSRWAFKAGWGETLRKLQYELDRIHASDCSLGVVAAPGNLRRDGWLRADARVTHPGVELAFTVPAADSPAARRGRALIRRYGTARAAMAATHPDRDDGSQEDFLAIQAATHRNRLLFATDAYDLWQHNVRAIALTLEALRAVDRYGSTQGRQYSGFAQLTPGPPTTT